MNSFRGGASTGAPVDVSNIRKEGWVMKESAMLRQYRKRWLVLTPDRLYSFKYERRYEAPTEDVDLKLCGTVKSADDLTNRQFSFTVQVSVSAWRSTSPPPLLHTAPASPPRRLCASQVPDRNFYLATASDA